MQIKSDNRIIPEEQFNKNLYTLVNNIYEKMKLLEKL